MYEKKSAVLLSPKYIKQSRRTFLWGENPYSGNFKPLTLFSRYGTNHMYTRYWSSIAWWTARAIRIKAVFCVLFVNQLRCIISLLSNKEYQSNKNFVFWWWYEIPNLQAIHTTFCFIIKCAHVCSYHGVLTIVILPYKVQMQSPLLLLPRNDSFPV